MQRSSYWVNLLDNKMHRVYRSQIRPKILPIRLAHARSSRQRLSPLGAFYGLVFARSLIRVYREGFELLRHLYSKHECRSWWLRHPYGQVTPVWF